MQDRIQIKHNGAYITLPALMRQYGRILLEYKPAANMIQVKTVNECIDGFTAGRSLGALKHDFGDES